MKDMLTEIKNKFVNKNSQGINSRVNEAKHRINDLEQKEEINIQLNRIKKQEFKKNEERLRNLWNNFKHSNAES